MSFLDVIHIGVGISIGLLAGLFAGILLCKGDSLW